MKQLLLSLLLVCGAGIASAQFQIGDAEVPSMGRAGSLRDDDLAMFKKSTTIFVVQPKDKDRIPDFEKSIADVWKITPFKVVTATETGPYRGRKYSLFTFGGFVVITNNSTHTHISYDLTIPNFNKHGELDGRTILARFVLSPDFKTVAAVSGRIPVNAMFVRQKEDRATREANALNKDAVYANFGPGQMRGYLKAINDHLMEAERRGLFDEITEKDKIKALAKDTLYLPDYLKVKFSMFTGDERQKEDDADIEEDAAKSYPFPLRYLPVEELEQMLVNSTKPIYHLIYIRSSSNKYISVVEAHSGEIIYSRFHNVSYNFKMKDLRKFADYVD